VDENPAPEPVAAAEDPPLPLYTRLGMISLVLGTLSVPVLCIPFVGYAAIGLSAIGLLVGVAGLFGALTDGGAAPAQLLRGTRRFGTRAPDYPLAGIVACLVVLALALLPFLLHRH
jgi:hypothetical protein